MAGGWKASESRGHQRLAKIRIFPKQLVIILSVCFGLVSGHYSQAWHLGSQLSAGWDQDRKFFVKVKVILCTLVIRYLFGLYDLKASAKQLVGQVPGDVPNRPGFLLAQFCLLVCFFCLLASALRLCACAFEEKASPGNVPNRARLSISKVWWRCHDKHVRKRETRKKTH